MESEVVKREADHVMLKHSGNICNVLARDQWSWFRENVGDECEYPVVLDKETNLMVFPLRHDDYAKVKDAIVKHLTDRTLAKQES